MIIPHNTRAHLYISRILLKYYAYSLSICSSQKFVQPMGLIEDSVLRNRVLFCGLVLTKSFAIAIFLGNLF